MYVQENSDTVESLGKLRPSRQFGEVLVGHLYASPLLLTLKATHSVTERKASMVATSRPETHRVQRERGAEALLLDALQQRLRVPVGAVQDQHAFPCGGRGRSLEGGALGRLGVRGQGSTWGRDDRLQVSLVQLQLVSRVDHLHHRRVLVPHLLQRDAGVDLTFSTKYLQFSFSTPVLKPPSHFT